MAGAVLFVAGAITNRRQDIDDHFAVRSIAWKLFAGSGPANVELNHLRGCVERPWLARGSVRCDCICGPRRGQWMRWQEWPREQLGEFVAMPLPCGDSFTDVLLAAAVPSASTDGDESLVFDLEAYGADVAAATVPVADASLARLHGALL